MLVPQNWTLLHVFLSPFFNELLPLGEFIRSPFACYIFF